MRITWYGHAAFLIETAGKRIILDPYRSPDCGGYRPIDEPADVIAVSHENDRYHSHLGQILPPFEVVRGLEFPPEGHEVLGLLFQAVRVFETPERLPEDEVTILHFRSEGLKVVFLGDLGHTLSGPEIDPIRDADVLLVPAGGPPTLALEAMPTLLKSLRPRLVLPMHYKTGGINLAIRLVEDFLAALPGIPVDRPGRPWLDVSPATLPAAPHIVVLDHAR